MLVDLLQGLVEEQIVVLAGDWALVFDAGEERPHSIRI